jgi:UrcA family protein
MSERMPADTWDFAAIAEDLATDTNCRNHPTKHFEERNVKRTNVLQCGSRQLLVSGFAAIVLGLSSASSFATTPIQAVASRDATVRSVKVSFGELDLTKPAGAEALYRRIKKAAFVVCGGYESPMPLSYTARSQCFKTAIDDAVAKVNSPLLTSLHRNENTRLASK